MGTKKPRIKKSANVLKTEITFDFTDSDGVHHNAKVLRDQANPKFYEVTVDGKKLKKEKKLDNFLFCEKDKKGTVKIGKHKYNCHEIKEASEGALILGNRICPLVINPPGIVINL